MLDWVELDAIEHMSSSMINQGHGHPYPGGATRHSSGIAKSSKCYLARMFFFSFSQSICHNSNDILTFCSSTPQFSEKFWNGAKITRENLRCFCVLSLAPTSAIAVESVHPAVSGV